MVEVSLAGVLMDGSTPDAYGAVWTAESVDGWDSAPVRIDDSDRTGQHGGYGSARLFGSRLLTVSGFVDCPDLAGAFDARDRLHLMNDGALTVIEPVPRMVSVVSGGSPRATDPLEGSPSWFKFSIPLVSYDPFKREPDDVMVAVAAGATVSHTAGGKSPAEIEVTLTSGGTVDLTIGSQRLRWGALPSGSVLTSGPGFTNRRRTVVGPSGENLFGLIIQPMQWPAISPGSNSLHQSGTAGLSVRYFPTYA